MKDMFMAEQCYEKFLITGPKDVKDLFSTLKDCAAELNGSSDTIKYQVLFCSLYSVTHLVMPVL